MNPTVQDQLDVAAAEEAPEVYTFPLSFAQQRIWLLSQLEEHGAAYHIAGGFRVRGPLRHETLHAALGEIVARHESLRTTFAVVDGEPAQVVAPERRVELPVTDLRALPAAERGAELERLSAEHAREPFDLAAGPLARWRLVRMEDEAHVLLSAMHHLVTDGWSEGVFLRELVTLYRAFAAGRPSPLEELPIQYGDFSVWERDYLQGETLEGLLAYWRGQLADAPEALDLPTDRPRPAEPSYRGASEPVSLPEPLRRALAERGRAEDSSLYATLLAAYGVLLHRRSGAEVVLVGSPVANRGQVELEGLIGLFLNTVALRLDFTADPTFRQLLRGARDVAYGAQEHQSLPFEKLVAELRPGRDRSRTPFFQVFFNLETTAPAAGAGDGPAGGVSFTPFQVGTGSSKLEMILNLQEAPSGLVGSVEYSTDLFDAATVRRMIGELRLVMEAVARDPDLPVSRIPLLDGDEERRLVAEWNATDRDYPRDVTLDGLFADAAARHADSVAVTGGGASLTFAELDRRAGRVAARLAALGVGPEVPVAVCMHPSPDMVAAVLGVLRAGGAYLPVDPATPAERAAWLLEDAGARVVVTHSRWTTPLPASARVLSLDGMDDWADAEGAAPSGVGPDNLAYVIYTSGSTGRPKGVMIPHRGAANYLAWCGERYPAGNGAPLHGSVAVDMSITTLFAPLLAGRPVVLPEAEGGVEELGAMLGAGRGFGFVKVTPTHLQLLAPTLSPARAATSTRALIVGGEALPAESVAAWRAAGVRVINEYGPTETVVGCSVHEVGADDPATGFVPIGRPIANTRIYVLDARGAPVPVGVAGEVYVGGAQVTRGYLRRPGLTAEKFLPDPFSPTPGARLYRTGDLARHGGGGALEFLGRADRQVKVRGWRVEPGEVETALVEAGAAREAVVVVREDVPGEARLVAYLVGEGELSLAEVRAALTPRLPEYMLPAAVVRLESLPLTPGGKVDRKALPAPAAERPRGGPAFVAPRNTVEEALASIWCKVLQLDQVGVHDNFFSVGGDSIRSLMVAGLARERGLPLSIRQIAGTPTIAELAIQIAAGTAGGDGEVKLEPFAMISDEDRARLPDDVVDAYPLSRMQLGMLYHRDRTPTAPLFHSINSHHLRMAWDAEKFRAAVLHVAERHPNLRTSFDLAGYGEPLQLVHADAVFPVPVFDLRHLAPDEQDAELKAFWKAEKERPFDLAEVPQLRFHIHLRGDDTVQFTLTENHAIVDGWSLHIIFGELLASYFGLVKGEGFPALPELRSRFRDFVWLERKALESPEAREYWSRKLEGYRPVRLPSLPSHRPDYAGQRVARVDRILTPRLHGRLRRLARDEAVPLKSVLLAAHLKVMSYLTGDDDVVTGLSGNGRLETADAERVCGLFLNTLPVRGDLSGGSWRDLVKQAHQAELELLPVRRYPMAEVQSQWGPEPLHDTSFVYLNFHAVGEQVRSGDVEYVGMGAMIEETNYAIMTAFMHLPGYASQIALSLSCDRWIFTDAQIRRLAGYYLATLEAMVRDPGARHEAMTPLADDERAELAAWGAGGEAAEPEAAFTPVHRRFELHAARSPDRECLVMDDGALSYARVDRWADGIARQLRALGIGREARVMIAIDRAAELVPALLGVLKAGAAYVPVDPAYPDDRLRTLLHDSGARAILCLGALRERLAGLGVPALAVELEAAAAPTEGGGDEPRVEVDPANLAYVVYTSGTTGRPKGVAVEHRQLAAYVDAATERLELPAGGRYGMVSTFAADLGNTALFSALVTGGALLVASEREATDPDALAERLAGAPVDVLKVVPSHLRALLSHPDPARVLPRERLVLGGESPDWELVERVRAAVPGCRVFNHYGPTETTVGVVAGELEPGEDDAPTGRPPLGLPLAGTRGYVLGPRLELVPAGTGGELHVGGATVSRGYLGGPALTAERFIPDPFAAEPGARMYRTGDRVRRLADGRLEFVGRTDDQVKIRGFRVEPGEARAALRAHPAVADALVTARHDSGEPRLVAYFVAPEAAAPAEDELRAFAARSLPPQAVPARFVRLDALPLTANGKVDLRALPSPDGWAARVAEPVAPRTPVEEKLVQLWKEVLKTDRVGVYDSFFDMGGDSIRAILAVARVRRAFGIALTLDTLFAAGTVAGLAGMVEMALQAQGSTPAAPVAPAPRDGPLPLSFAQQRFWYAHLLEPGSPAQNLPLAIRLRGPLDEAALGRALDETARRHEVLRTRFPTVDGEPRLAIDPPAPVALTRVDPGEATEPAGREANALREVRAAAWAPFDLERGPLLRALLARVDDDDHMLGITLHHVVTDGWSVGVLLRELGELYSAFAEGKPSPLPELPVQYADYALWQRENFQGDTLDAQLAYWRGKLEGAPVLEIPTDHPRPAAQGYRGAAERVGLSGELTARFRETSQREGVTLFMSLLTAWAVLLHHRGGQEDVVVGAPVATHRDREELQGVIGSFLNTLALRVQMAGDPDFRELLARVRRTALEAYSNQELPFDRLVEALNLPRNTGRPPLVQVWFNHSGIPGARVRFAGLKVQGVDVGDEAVKFDLQLSTEEVGGRLAASLRYNADLYERPTVVALLADLEALLARVAADPSTRLSELRAALDEEARARDTRDWGERGEAARRGLQSARRKAVSITT
ncbi:MAG TPA: amino acid adenylation domain-containing protein [Longimicrobium sp.]|nr:amino acid adenylation domain-containing protein [Longimicrobium sp.]